MSGEEVCWGGLPGARVGDVREAAGGRFVGEVGSRGGRRAWGVRGACVGAISVGIARSALLSGYLGKSRHLPIGHFFSDMKHFCPH